MQQRYTSCISLVRHICCGLIEVIMEQKSLHLAKINRMMFGTKAIAVKRILHSRSGYSDIVRPYLANPYSEYSCAFRSQLLPWDPPLVHSPDIAPLLDFTSPTVLTWAMLRRDSNSNVEAKAVTPFVHSVSIFTYRHAQYTMSRTRGLRQQAQDNVHVILPLQVKGH